MIMYYCNTQGDAVSQYSELVDSLLGGHGASETTPPNPDNVSVSSDDLLVTMEGGVQTITLNRPRKKNAISIKVL